MKKFYAPPEYKDFPYGCFVFRQTPIYKSIKLHPFSLKFPSKYENLEKEFCKYHYYKNIISIRITMFLSILLYGCFGVLDKILAPTQTKEFWFVRFGIVIPGFLFIKILTYFPQYRKLLQPALGFVMVLAGLGIIYIINIAVPPVNYLYYAGLILILMLGCCYARIRFIIVAPAGLAIVLLYQIVAIYNHTPMFLLINNNFFFVSAIIIGMLSAYTMEYYERRDFILVNALNDQQNETLNANAELEHRVKERTADLLNNQIKYKEIFENIQDVYFEINPEGFITEISPSIFNVIQYRREELIGHPLTNLLIPNLNQKDLVREIFNQPSLRLEDFEIQICTKCGKKRFCTLTAAIIDRPNQPLKVVGSLRDIENRKQVEQLKTNFVSIASHELRTPLHSMLLRATGMLGGYSGDLPQHIKDDLAIIKQSIDQMTDIVDTFLDLSKIEAKQLKVYRQKIFISDLIHHSVEKVQKLLDNYNHQLRLNIENEIPKLDIDQDRMSQAVINILTNAIKFTPENGIIEIHVTRSNGDVKIKVADNGYGVPLWAQEKIFHEFFQADLIMSQRLGGAGLGLPITRGIVKQHQGHISCESPIPPDMFQNFPLGGDRKGSIFTIELPIGL